MGEPELACAALLRSSRERQAMDGLAGQPEADTVAPWTAATLVIDASALQRSSSERPDNDGRAGRPEAINGAPWTAAILVIHAAALARSPGERQAMNGLVPSSTVFHPKEALNISTEAFVGAAMAAIAASDRGHGRSHRSSSEVPTAIPAQLAYRERRC